MLPISSNRLVIFRESDGGYLCLTHGLNTESTPTQPEVENHGGRKAPPTFTKLADKNATVGAVAAYYPPLNLCGLVGPSDRFPALEFDLKTAAAKSDGSPHQLATRASTPKEGSTNKHHDSKYTIYNN